MGLGYKINKGKVVHRTIGGEAVMLNLDNGCYYSLDEIGTRIWKAIDGSVGLEELLGLLTREYLVSESKLKEDIRNLLSSLEKAQLITKT